jgi:predicted PurR-regulated permease PerM
MNFSQCLGLISLLISLYIIWQISHVILLVFGAIVLAVALNKLTRLLQKMKIKRGIAVIISVLLLFFVTIIFFVLIVPPFVSQFQQLTQLFPKGLDKVNQWLDQLTNTVPDQVVPYVPDVDSLIDQVQPFFNRILGGSVVIFTKSLGFVLEFLFVLVLMIMMLANPPAYRRGFVRLFPSFYRRRVDEILYQCEIALGRWFGGALISMSVIALLSWISLLILGVKLAVAHAIIAGLLNFIPNIGPTLSVVLPMAIALLDAPWKSGAVLIIYILIQQFESNILTPYIMSQQVSLLPAVTLLSQVFFTSFFGSLGLLLSLPLTVVSQIWIKEAIIKDIFDQWHKDKPQDQPLEVAVNVINEIVEVVETKENTNDDNV